MLCDRGEIAGGSTSRAMGGVRQQFSTAPEVELARESIAFFEELGEPFFNQVGYLFLATTEDGLAALEERVALQERLGVAVERVDPSFVAGLASTTCSARRSGPKDGTADPAGVARELVRRAAELGVEVRANTGARELAPRADTRRDRVRAVVGRARRAARRRACPCGRSAASCC